MSEETNNAKPWLPWAVAFAVLVGIAFLVEYMEWYNIFIMPWIIAEGASTMQAIDAFDKLTSPEAVCFDEQIRILISVLIFFIVGPACWIWGEIRSQKKHITFKSVVWYMGVIIVSMGLLSATVGTTIKSIRFQDSTEQAHLSAMADEMRSDLRKAANKAVELYYLPTDQGGGSQSFRAFKDSAGNNRPIRLSDLSTHIPSDKTFVLKHVQSDSSITIYSISDLAGEDPDFKNANGQKGLLQMAISINSGGGCYGINESESNIRFQ